MREPFVFDPRHPLCKTPFGAAVCGSQIALRCRPLAAEGLPLCLDSPAGVFPASGRN